ncbi:TPA: hypothetical protein HA225_00220 [Candidatus Micrarchaeota archaeon]|nr:hypothetical protein [Candidatus Micrarchaeota archaeon]HIH29925.1 hypothetical protein [Candidatus Micrarchaeota archaeon]
MGVLDGLLGKGEEAAAVPGLPFNISTSLRPVRLNARKESSLEVLVAVKNVTDSQIMVSVSAEVPPSLGFENLGITRIKEIRIGELPAKKEKTVSFSVSSSSQTPAGVYSILIVVSHHYRDYSHVQNYAKKTVEIRAV